MATLMHKNEPDHSGRKWPAVEHGISAYGYEHTAQTGEFGELQRAYEVLALPGKKHTGCSNRGQTGCDAVSGWLWRTAAAVHLPMLLLLLLLNGPPNARQMGQ